jgi:hypothetical protein
VVDEAPGDLEQTEYPAKFGDVCRWYQVFQGVEVLLGQADAGGVHFKSKKFSASKTEAGFMNIQCNIVLEAHAQELLEVENEDLQVIFVPQPIVDVVGQLLQ